MAIRYHTIIEQSHVDGPGGPRTVLVMQGCSIECKGCQNKALWPSEGGHEMGPIALAEDLLSRGSKNITITGGEPTDQGQALWHLMVGIRFKSHDAHVIIYTGREFEWFFQDLEGNEDKQAATAALLMADTVVDGPFVAEQDDDRLQWRGSRNQRPIDIRASEKAARDQGKGAAYLPRYIKLEDWDTPTLILTSDGDIIGAKGLIEELTTTTQEATDETRRCGQL